MMLVNLNVWSRKVVFTVRGGGGNIGGSDVLGRALGELWVGGKREGRWIVRSEAADQDRGWGYQVCHLGFVMLLK